jgi:hypothetical protein
MEIHLGRLQVDPNGDAEPAALLVCGSREERERIQEFLRAASFARKYSVGVRRIPSGEQDDLLVLSVSEQNGPYDVRVQGLREILRDLTSHFSWTTTQVMDARRWALAVSIATEPFSR